MSTLPGSAEVRSWFPIVERVVYMAHVAQGTLSTHTLEALADFAGGDLVTGYQSKEKILSLWATARSTSASLIGAQSDDITFVGSTSEGLGMIAAGIAWNSGDNVVITDQEHLANEMPWRKISDGDIELRIVSSAGGAMSTERIIEHIDAQTRVVASTWVSHQTGQRIDLSRLGAKCRETGALFCVDGIQGVGVIPVDIRCAEVDVLVAGGYKWLLAPGGIGVMYMSERALREVSPVVVGSLSYEWRPGAIPSNRSDLELWPSARRFEAGNPNMMGLVALETAITDLLTVGIESIARHVTEITEYIGTSALVLGYEVVQRTEAMPTGIISLRHPFWDAKSLEKYLSDAGVITAAGGNYLRIAPHLYNSMEEADAVVGLLKAAI